MLIHPQPRSKSHLWANLLPRSNSFGAAITCRDAPCENAVDGGGVGQAHNYTGVRTQKVIPFPVADY